MATAFADHCNKSAREFIQNVLVIDDGASIDAVLESPAPKVAQRISASALDQKPIEANPAANSSPTAVAPTAATPDTNATTTAPTLDASQLTEAFFNYGIVVGLFKPTSANLGEIVQKTVTIARKTDAVILDWMINSKSPDLCKEIIRAIIYDDHENGGGRLRTIVIYTAESDLNGRLKELTTYLAAHAINDFLTGNAITYGETDDYTIESPNLRISFYSKAHGKSPDTDRKKTEDQLPGVVVAEFSAHSKGLLPTFALGATTIIRKNTHHLLTRFVSDLDGAYLSHRGMLTDHDDAEPFMLENFVSVIRNILSLERVDKVNLGKSSITNFLADRITDYSGTVQGNALTFTPTELNTVFVGPSSFTALMETKGVVVVEGDPKSENKLFIDFAKILTDNDSKSLYQFSVLTSYRRSHADVGWASPTHIPYLTQGTVIAKALPAGQYDFYFCVTPKCDSIRISSGRRGTTRPFSFVKLKPGAETDSHDLIANVKGQYFHLTTKPKFFKLVHVDFRSDNTTHRVEASYNAASKEFLLKDAAGVEYLWIGDLKDLHSQSKVSELVGDLNRIGFDEFEWIRRNKRQ